MKTYLSFNDNSEDDRDKLKTMLQADRMSVALWEISQEIFRPARKHGYDDPRLNKLLEIEGVSEAIGLLEERFVQILREREVSID